MKPLPPPLGPLADPTPLGRLPRALPRRCASSAKLVGAGCAASAAAPVACCLCRRRESTESPSSACSPTDSRKWRCASLPLRAAHLGEGEGEGEGVGVGVGEGEGEGEGEGRQGVPLCS